jgi:hypothetical protein
MLFPKEANKLIAKSFYDKAVDVLDKSETVDSEGGAVKTSGTVKSTFQANVRFTALSKVQTELGLTDDIDVAITCATDTAVAVDDLLQYKGVKYVATDVLPFDSHILIVGKKWQTA